MSAPILPRVADIITPGIDAIVAARPESLPHFNDSGHRWSDLPAIWRAELLLNLARLGDEVGSARLRFATGDTLRALCASEFNTVLPSAPQPAQLSIVVSRPTNAAGGTVIRKGTKFVKIANPNSQPLPIAACTYEALQTVYIPPTFQYPSILGFNCVATKTGPDGNIPIFRPQGNYIFPPASIVSTIIAPAQSLLDPTLYVVSGREQAAGGSSGITDAVLVAAAKAYAIGQYGANDGALLAGILRTQSVRHVAMFPATGPSLATGFPGCPWAQAFPVDQSWASSPQFSAIVQQQYASVFQGFGCYTQFGTITNLQVALAATLVLKNQNDLNYTDDIDTNVRAAAESYFNDRPDWYRWNSSALQAMLSVCDSRIQQCSSVALTDSVGNPVTTVDSSINIRFTGISPPTLIHYFLTDRNVTTSYLAPT